MIQVDKICFHLEITKYSEDIYIVVSSWHLIHMLPFLPVCKPGVQGDLVMIQYLEILVHVILPALKTKFLYYDAFISSFLYISFSLILLSFSCYEVTFLLHIFLHLEGAIAVWYYENKTRFQVVLVFSVKKDFDDICGGYRYWYWPVSYIYLIRGKDVIYLLWGCVLHVF